MIGRKSSLAAKAAAARGKASMNARGTSTSPPPGVSRGSPQSSVKKGMPVKPTASQMQQMETISGMFAKGRPSAGVTPTRVKNPNTKGDENYVPPKVQPVAPKSSVEYLPGPNGEKYPVGINRNRGPVMPGPVIMPKQTPSEIDASKAKLAEKQRLNPNAVAPNIGQQAAQMRAAMQQMQKTPMPASGPAPGQPTGQAPGMAQKPMGSPMGSPMGMKKGGSVKGAGAAKRGTRPCKYV